MVVRTALVGSGKAALGLAGPRARTHNSNKFWLPNKNFNERPENPRTSGHLGRARPPRSSVSRAAPVPKLVKRGMSSSLWAAQPPQSNPIKASRAC